MSKISWRHTVIAIVDDSADWRRVVRAMCLSFGATQVHEAADGSALLHLAEAERLTFDLLLVDDDMQPMDGFLLLRSLRSTADHPSRYATALLMPGDGGVGILRKALDAGFHGVLPKPFSAQALGDRVERLLLQPMQWKEDGELILPVLPKPGQA